MSKRLLGEGPFAHRPDVGVGGEDVIGVGIRHSGPPAGVDPLELGGDLFHHLGRERVAGLGASSLSRVTPNASVQTWMYSDINFALLRSRKSDSDDH